MDSNTKEWAFDITIFGQPVIDHVITLQNPFRYGELMNICQLTSKGEVILKDQSWIRTLENEQEYFFGMPLKYPDGHSSLTLLPGKKVAVGTLQKHVVTRPELIARLGRPIVNLGGGGPNVLQILNQVFGKFHLEFIGGYAPMSPDGAIDPSVTMGLTHVPPLLSDATPPPRRKLELAPIYETVPVNIVIEGMRGNGEQRGVLKSPFTERLIGEPYHPNGRAIMVNTVYSKTLAVNALCYAVKHDRFGVVALTESLCNDQDPFSKEERAWIERFLKLNGMEAVLRGIRTLYDFILTTIIPEGPDVLIMNESEFDHLLNPRGHDSSDRHHVTGQKKVAIVEERLVHLDSLLEGLQTIRKLQPHRKSKIYVTLNSHGSLCLDEHDVVHYSPITMVEGLPSKGKNAIGDTYAAIVLAGEYIARCKKAVKTPYIISSAAAAADAVFYSGFETISPATVDEYLAKTMTTYKSNLEQGNYQELGPLKGLQEKLNDLPLRGAPHIRLSDIERKEWFTLINPNGSRMGGHYALADVYGRKFLTLRLLNGSIG